MRKTKINKRSNKVKLSYTEILIRDLKDLSLAKTITEEQKELVDSLLRWYLVNHFLTSAQIRLAKSLVAPKQVKKTKPKKHYVYAISDGENIKIGMSSNVESRLKNLQTSNSKELLVVWKYYVGKSSKDAAKIEKMLHRACKEYSIRGEWFEMKALDIVNAFNPDRKHCAKWEYAKLVTVERKRRNGILNYTVNDIRRTNVTHKMNRVWEEKETKELYQKEISLLLEDLHVVLVLIE